MKILILLGALLVPLAGLQAAADVKDVDTILGRQQNSLAQSKDIISDLEARYRAAMPQTYQYAMERRLVDAQVMFDFKHYDKAAVLFAELLDDPAFRNNRDYWQVAFDAGFALYQLGNYRSAARYFQEVVDNNAPQYTQEALRHLLDIALSTRDFTLLSKYYRILDAIPGPSRSPGLAYAYAKALYFQDAVQNAAVEFQRIPQASEYYARACYYQGVIATRQKDYAGASGFFRQAAASAKPENEAAEFAELKDLSILAVGRLLEEMGQYPQAIDAYQDVPRTSRHFEDSLYETAWSFIKMGSYDKALGTLDTLVLVVKDENLSIQANILRGRLNIFLQHFDDAEDSYTSVVDLFTPLKNELLSFLADRKNVSLLFRWLMTSGDAQASLRAPLSDRALAWMGADDQMRELLGVFQDVRTQKAEVDEFRRIIAQMRARLESSSSIQVFPNLAEGLYAVMEQENRLLRVGSGLLEAQRAYFEPQLDPQARAELKALRDKRLQVEKQFEAVPFTAVAYGQRYTEAAVEMDRLDAEVFVAETRLKEYLKELASFERWIAENSTDAAGRLDMTPEAARVQAAVDQEQALQGQLMDRIRDMKNRVEVLRVTTGAGDATMTSESDLKAALKHAQEAESAFYAARKDALQGRWEAQEARVMSLRLGVESGLKSLAGIMSAIREKTSSRVQETRRRVADEESRLDDYVRELDRIEGSTMALSEEIGSTLFSIARDEIQGVVLEADLGLVDMAWQRKQELTGAIQTHNEARSKQIKQIDSNLKDFLGN
jgi:tetratricopeptide (TPR) repeat protein